MHYYFVDQVVVATGVCAEDQEPRHVHCESLLQIEPGWMEAGGREDAATQWRCPDCGGAGRVQYLPEYIDLRTRKLPDPPVMPDPPASPLDWQEYLDEYFSEGVLFLGVHNLPGYPVRDTSVFVVSDKVNVTLGPGHGPELTVLDRSIERPYTMRDVQRLIQHAPGTLIVHGPEGKTARLDARLTEAEKSHVHLWNHTCYFLRQHHCGQEACPYCGDLKFAAPCPYCESDDEANGESR